MTAPGRRASGPPAWLFLALGVGSAVAAAVFVLRAAVVDVTPERVVSAVAFASLGALWLYAWRSARR